MNGRFRLYLLHPRPLTTWGLLRRDGPFLDPVFVSVLLSGSAVRIFGRDHFSEGKILVRPRQIPTALVRLLEPRCPGAAVRSRTKKLLPAIPAAIVDKFKRFRAKALIVTDPTVERKTKMKKN